MYRNLIEGQGGQYTTIGDFIGNIDSRVFHNRWKPVPDRSSAHTTTVSQKVPVEDTSAWRTGFRVCAAAAAIGAEPIPDSLENRSSGNSVTHRQHDTASYQTAGCCSRLECQALQIVVIAGMR